MAVVLNMGRWAAKSIFVLLAMAVAGYALTFFNRPVETGNLFAMRLVISDADVPLHFFSRRTCPRTGAVAGAAQHSAAPSSVRSAAVVRMTAAVLIGEAA